MSMPLSASAVPALRASRPLPAPEPAILTREALAFVKSLTLCFRAGLKTLLAERDQAQAGFDRGERPGFLPETERVRAADWALAPLPVALMDRRVELLAEPGGLAEARRSGARGCIADFQDRLAPTLDNLLCGQQALYRASREERHPGATPAPLLVRPRGLHLPEPHLEVEGEPVPAALFDIGLFLFHNARALLARGATPHLCLPLLEHHREARWWNRVLEAVENDLGLPACSVRTTLGIDTLPAVFQMDECLHEHRHRAVALHLGPNACLTSFIRTFRTDPAAVTGDPGALSLDQPCLRAWTQLLARTCHRRGAAALGGLCAGLSVLDAQTGGLRPVRSLDGGLRHSLEQEARIGCDGTWVADPALVPMALAAFDAHMPGLNQLHRIPDPPERRDLLAVPAGARTGRGLRQDLRVGIHFLEGWLNGEGCVALDGLLEDAASAELARMQLWQWVNHGVDIPGAGRMDRPLFHCHVQDALYQIQAEVGEEAFAEGRFLEAADLLETQILEWTPPAFLLPSACDLLAGPLAQVR